MFYEDNRRVEDFDDVEMRELKQRTRQKAKLGADLSAWKYGILTNGINRRDKAPETFIVLNYMSVMIQTELI